MVPGLCMGRSVLYESRAVQACGEELGGRVLDQRLHLGHRSCVAVSSLCCCPRAYFLLVLLCQRSDANSELEFYQSKKSSHLDYVTGTQTNHCHCTMVEVLLGWHQHWYWPTSWCSTSAMTHCTLLHIVKNDPDSALVGNLIILMQWNENTTL